MKVKVIAALFVLSASTSLMAADAPAVEARLVRIKISPDVFPSSGPVNLQYQLTIKNPMVDHSITLRRLTLRTQPGSAYRVRASYPMTMVINPESSATISVAAQGRPSEGLLRTQAPVHMSIQLRFDRQDGKPFIKQFTQNLP
jgi:hypothetical protein